MSSGFLGPWFCSLFFNTSNDCKKQTHLEAHTYPHLAEDALNKGSGNLKDFWVIVLKIGPFNEWRHAENFLRLWALRTRGKTFRLERGARLFEAYRERYALKMWVQRQAREYFSKICETMTTSTMMIPYEAEAVEEEAEAEEECFSFSGMFRGPLEEITMKDIETIRMQLEKKGNLKKKRRRTIKL